MKTLPEIEYYVTTTYKSLIWNKDPEYGGVQLTHPFRAALTETATILALPTCTTPEILLAWLEDEVRKVNDWTHTPAKYIEQLLMGYQDIMNFIVEGIYTMSDATTTEQRTIALAWLMEHAQPGTKVFVHVTPYPEVSLADVYVFLPNAQGELQSFCLNRSMKNLGIAKMNKQEHLLEHGPRGGIAQDLAERLGGAVFDDRRAYLSQLL